MVQTSADGSGSAGPGIGVLHEVRGRFNDSDQLAQAVDRLLLAGFARGDVSLPEPDPPVERSTPASGAEPAYTEDDATTARTLHTSGAASAAALLAAGLTVGTGGAAAAAFAAGLGAAAAAGGATFAVTKAADDQEQQTRDDRAAQGSLILSVRAPTAEKRAEAETILRAAGALDLRAG